MGAARHLVGRRHQQRQARAQMPRCLCSRTAAAAAAAARAAAVAEPRAQVALHVEQVEEHGVLRVARPLQQ